MTRSPPGLQAVKSDEAHAFSAEDFNFTADELEDMLGGRSSNGRLRRIKGGNPMEKKDFRLLIELILGNSTAFEAQGRILRIKNYIPCDASPLEIDLILAALRKNSRIEVLYIQNFERGMTDQQLYHLVEVLKERRQIWAVNIGENYQITPVAWEWFIDNLPFTSIGYTYLSEHHIDAPTKRRIIELVRNNRKRDEKECPRDPEVCMRVGNMWWNPPVRGMKDDGIRPNLDGVYEEEQLAQLRGTQPAPTPAKQPAVGPAAAEAPRPSSKRPSPDRAAGEPSTSGQPLPCISPEQAIENEIVEICRRTRGRKAVEKDEFRYAASSQVAYKVLQRMVDERRMIQIGRGQKTSYLLPEHKAAWEEENRLTLVFEGESGVATVVRGYAPPAEQMSPAEQREAAARAARAAEQQHQEEAPAQPAFEHAGEPMQVDEPVAA